MKKILILFLISLSLVSCDKIIYNDYVVINNCNEAITVSIILFNDTSINLSIETNSDSLFYSDEALSQTDNIVESAFKQISISKQGQISHKNYINKQSWQYKDIDDIHRTWYLTVTPQDFE